MEPTRIYFYLLLFIYYVFLIPSINTIFISILFLGEMPKNKNRGREG